MSGEPQLFRINPETRASERITEVDFSQLGFRERRDIQEWVAGNPGILGDDLLIVGKEFSGFDRTGERLDLLAVDTNGRLVIIELKRDDSGTDAHWQAIKYASYFRRTTAEQIIAILAQHSGSSIEDAENKILEHLNDDDLGILNSDQRIILASHRFAPEVISAVLWLNEKVSSESLITCVTLTPYRDPNTDSLYVQAATIVPVLGLDEYTVGIGPNISLPVKGAVVAANSRNTRRQSFGLDKANEAEAFLERVRTLALGKLPHQLRPDRVGSPRFRRRLCSRGFWYARSPWHRSNLRYSVQLRPQDPDSWRASVLFFNNGSLQLPELELSSRRTDRGRVFSQEVNGGSLDDEFANSISETLVAVIEQVTPIVDGLQDESTLQADEDDEEDEAED